MISISLAVDELLNFMNNLNRPPLSQFKTVQGSDAFNTKQDGVYDPIGGPGYNFNTVEWLETFGR